MTLLATYVHISDLHIGELDPVSGNARTYADLRRLASTFRVFHGSLGHQARSLRYLQRYLNELRAQREPFELIITGDYTRCGDQNEMQLAHSYVTSRVDLRPPRRHYSGLQLGSLPTAVPGNHDHWGGDNSNFSGFQSLFAHSQLCPPQGFPYVSVGPVLMGRQLRFFGINSDADVPPGSLPRILAHGAFRTQLNALSGFTPNPGNEIRVLVIHHAFHVTGWRLRMTPQSRQDLEYFLRAMGIQVILSGHTHKPFMGVLSPPGVVEFCSGTTTQIDEAPAGWRTLAGRAPTVRFDRNSFFVHRLHDDRGSLVWTAHLMLRSKTGAGFREAGRQTFIP